VWTSRQLGFPTDLGASWLEGAAANPIFAMAREEGIALELDDDEWVYRDSSGRDVTDQVDDTLEDLEERLEDVAGGKDMSVYDALKGSRVKKQFLNAFLNDQETDSGADCEQWSLNEWNRDTDFEGDSFLFPEGYGQLPELLAKDLDIRTGEIVTGVQQTKQGVTVTTKGAYRFQADRAIVTFSLGVLKDGGVTFDPPLPKEKRLAIGELGMGVLNAIVLHFPKVFWPKDVTCFGYVSTNRGEYPETLNGYCLSGEPYLMSFLAGSIARQTEKWSDAAIVDQVLGVYRRMFGSKVPQPTAHLITRWATDPWALGSYSYQPVGVTESARRQLAAPFQRLHFAGEATIPEHAATVHGAYLSGIRAAHEI
jgi:monoamine oxidase